MASRSNRSYLPKSLYGRAALILVGPVLALQLVVSVVFIQRHFEGVTEQMTRNVARELRFLRAAVAEADTLDAARAGLSGLAGPLAFGVTLPDPPPNMDSRRFYDFSGLQMIETLRDEMPGVAAVDLMSPDKLVSVWLDTAQGPMRAVFDRQRVSASNPHQLLVLMVVTGALMTVIAYFFLRRQLRPIARLAAAATAYGRGRVEPYRPRGAVEVRAAGNAFLDMRARIDRQMEQRTMMLSGVSHDMRTPLTRLRLGLAMMDSEEETEALLRDVRDMERLLDEFLAFARDETLDDPEIVNPADLVEEVVERFRGAGRAIRWTPPGGQGRGDVMLRPMAVARALENLIGNALRYGAACEVGLQVTPRAVRISVEDDGPGIPETDRAEAVKPFVRLDAARNQNRGSGVGLGLAIAQDIARRHGGSLVLGDSDSLGGLKADLVFPR